MGAWSGYSRRIALRIGPQYDRRSYIRYTNNRIGVRTPKSGIEWDANYPMAGQYYEWTCSVCSVTWALQSTGAIDPARDVYNARTEVGQVMGYPNCVNEVYGSMSSQCVIDTFAHYGFNAKQTYATFDQAYSICSGYTGVINPQGMYHYMGIRGVDGNDTGTIWVANSAQDYHGVWDDLTRSQFNSLGPVSLIYLTH